MLYKGLGAALKVAGIAILRCDKSLINPKFTSTQHNNAVALKTYLAARPLLPVLPNRRRPQSDYTSAPVSGCASGVDGHSPQLLVIVIHRRHL